MGDVWWGVQYFALLMSGLVFGRPGALGAVFGMLVFLVVDWMW